MENGKEPSNGGGGERKEVPPTEIASHFGKTYRLRQSFFVLAFRLITLELIFGIFGIFAYMVVRLMGIEAPFYLTGAFWILLALNLIWLVIVTLMFYSHYYVISPHEVLKSRGIIFRFTMARDLATVRSVRVRQNLIQRLLNYGTLELESDILWRNNFVINNIHNPYLHARCIDMQRMHHAEDGQENTTWVT